MSNIFIAFKLTFPETIFLFPIKKSVLTFLILKVIDARKFRKYMGILNAFILISSHLSCEVPLSLKLYLFFFVCIKWFLVSLLWSLHRSFGVHLTSCWNESLSSSLGEDLCFCRSIFISFLLFDYNLARHGWQLFFL